MSPYRIAGGVVAVIAAILLAWTAVISFVPDKPVLPTAAVELQAGSAGRSASGVLQARTTMQKWRAVSGPSAEAVAPPTAIGAGEKLNFTQRRNLSNAEQLVADWRRNMPEREQILQKPQFLSGVSSLPYPQANVFEQPEGRHWRTLHNSQVRYGGGWIIFGMLFVLATFLAVRGRVPIAEGESGERIQRFNALERANHWLTSSSFILMALTGLVLLYGKPLLLPLIGLDAYASVARWSAWLHMVFVVPFVIGVILMIALWAAANLPDRYDWPWLKRLGGFLHDSENPPADRFNAGQKVVFWGVVLGGLVLLISGLAMMYPF
ncbi:MAG: cytochrome b/b6 domain-containing protein, partial [Alphaproteobacteria bacterium]|nr:cytochrome b/b6 domain-containing protein [Alphaproteobacteria bacterium]